jgi:hypothetical protein
MQSAANKVIRFGRATMLAIGLGVSLALVLGAATVALAAVPGDPFKLGKVNIINNATTTLQGSVPGGAVAKSLLEVKREGTTSGPTLRVENNTSAAGARGIDIEVPTGKTPISVNSGAAKANLDVDRLDGRDEQDFVSASRVYRVGNSPVVQGPGGGETVQLTAQDGLSCDGDDVAIGGGGNALDIEDDLNGIVPFAHSYQVEFQDNGAPSNFVAFVSCSDSSKPFK